jgi:TRAP-type C4-dicarboxylate transport system permease small subunit
MIDKFEYYFVAINRWLLIIVLALMSLIVFTNVGLRYLTSHSLEWAEEVSRHLMIWLTFLGCGPVLRYGGHIAIENLQDILSSAWSKALRALIALMLFVFFAFFVYFGVLYAQLTQYQQTPATQISFAYIYSALPVGMSLCFIHWLLVVRGYVGERRFAQDTQFDATSSASL